ncbi:hypothetical protein KO481_05215 [Nocardia sp. NEAU-G5]|uniref:AB hydrolase-1 domain-containing protein n=1 Tax=Nocardia albiluteola TaxID=2842303 RepID=A0ABS6ASC0_9NOCA|nr:hypothetical protein [Nocardia albiluteola]MBU3060922.1 hypothetical protein [Nocardia albiluteola]
MSLPLSGRLTRLDLIAAAADPNPAFEDRARAAENDGLPAQLAPTRTRWFTPSALAENPWCVRYARDLVVRNRLEQWAASSRAPTGLETRPKLADITVPTRVTAGGRDLAYPPELMRTVADDIPGAQFHVIGEAPHMVSLETASQLAALLSE